MMVVSTFRRVLPTVLIAFLFATLFVTEWSLASPTTQASVNPHPITTYRHQIFSVNITVSNITDLVGWDFQLYWNKTQLSCLSTQIYVPEVWGQNAFTFAPGLQPDYNATHGRYWKAMVAVRLAPSFNGSWAWVNLTFKAKATGNSILKLYAKLGNSESEPIPHTTIDGFVTILPQTRYMQSDQHLINGLTAYKLQTNQSLNSLYAESDPSTILKPSSWGIRIWQRTQNGIESEITNGSPVLTAMRTSVGSGIQSITGTLPNTPHQLNTADTIVIRIYQSWGNTPIGWAPMATFITEQLGTTKLEAVNWTIYYYTQIIKIGYVYYARFWWGTATYNTRIQNFEYT